MKWTLALIALAGSVAAGGVLFQHMDRERQFRRLLAEGEQAQQSGDTYTAIEDFSGALALRPDSMVPYYRRGAAYHAEQRDDWAIRDLREAARLAPDSTQPLVALGEVYDARNEPSEAARWYGEAADRLRDDDPALLYALALARYRAGSPAAAIDPLRRAIDRNDSVAQTYYLLGLVYRDTNQIGLAIDALQQAIKMAPSLTPAREELADLFRSQHRPDDELAELQSLAALNPTTDRHIAVAMVAAERGHFDAALTTLSDASAANPGDPTLQVARARVYLERAERTLDPQWARHAREILGKTVDARNARSAELALLGRATYLSGDLALAERQLRRATAVSPVDPVAFLYLADACERQARTLDARDALKSLDALEGDTATPTTRAARARRIGTLSLRSGDPTTAAEYLTKAVDGGQADAATLALLADASWQAGSPEAAKTFLAQGLAVDPRNADLMRLARVIK